MDENTNLVVEKYEYYCTVCGSTINKHDVISCLKCKSEIGSQTASGIGFRRIEYQEYVNILDIRN